MDITKDIRSLTEFKRETAKVVAHLKDSGQPSILTVNGKAELVVMDAETWQDMQDQIEFAQAVAGIRRGLDDMEGGSGAVKAADARAFFDVLRAEQG